jgi:NitT/TauT family transport system substrate-binding protein
MEKIPNLKPEIRDKIILPAYTKAALPDDEYINKIIGWTSKVMNKGLTVKAGDLVERKFTNP